MYDGSRNTQLNQEQNSDTSDGHEMAKMMNIYDREVTSSILKLISHTTKKHTAPQRDSNSEGSN